MPTLRSIVIIDGSNLYHKLRSLDLSKLHQFDYFGFCQSLTKGSKLIQLYFCIGKIHAKQQDAKARKMMAKQQSLVTRLQKQDFIIQFGYLLKYNDHFHEKGTDIQMAVDLLRGAYKNTYDIAYLISSDSDLIPAIAEVQALSKTVEYVGFHHQPSYALLKTCKQSRLLDKTDFEPFLAK